jgi:hypothetical protein
MEERYPAPVQFFDRVVGSDGSVEFFVERLKVSIPNRQGNYFYAKLADGGLVQLKQRDRNQMLKNKQFEDEMDTLIRRMQSRDTDTNIKRLATELEKIDLRKSASTSMFKIKQNIADQVRTL